MLTNQTLRGGASPRKSGWGPVVTAQQGLHGQGGAQPGQALPTCPGPFAVGPASPFPSPCPPPGWAAQRFHYHVSGHMYILATRGRAVGGHLLLYVLGSLFFSLKGKQFPSESVTLSGPNSPSSSFSLFFLPITTHTCVPHTNTLYRTVPAISLSTATFLWNSRDSVSHGPKVLLRHPAAGPSI